MENLHFLIILEIMGFIIALNEFYIANLTPFPFPTMPPIQSLTKSIHLSLNISSLLLPSFHYCLGVQVLITPHWSEMQILHKG